jgi:Flp pilus assembly protein TadD
MINVYIRSFREENWIMAEKVSRMAVVITMMLLVLMPCTGLQGAEKRRAILIVGNKNDQAISKSEIEMREKLREFMSAGVLDRSDTKIIVFDFSVGEHKKKYLDKLGIGQGELPFLGITELDGDGLPMKVIWKTRAMEPLKAIMALFSEMGIEVPGRPTGAHPVATTPVNTPEVQKKEQFHADLQTGDSCYYKGDYNSSIQQYTKALNEDPACAHALNFRGMAYFKIQEFKRAIEDLSSYAQLKPHDPAGFRYRGLSYLQLKNLEGALSDINRAIELKPDTPEDYCSRGIIYDSTGDHDRALSDYSKAISLDPQGALPYVNRSIIYFNKGDYNRAISDCTQAIALNPGYADAYCNRGNCHYVLKNFEKAVEDYNETIRLNPDKWQAYCNRAKCYYVKRDYTKAWADVHKCQEAGGTPEDSFLEVLRKASGKKE